MLSGLIRWEVMPRWMIRKMVINPGPRIEESKLAILSSATELVRNLQLVLEAPWFFPVQQPIWFFN